MLLPLEERAVPDATVTNPNGYTPYDTVGSGSGSDSGSNSGSGSGSESGSGSGSGSGSTSGNSIIPLIANSDFQGVVTLEYRPAGTDDAVLNLIMPIEGGGVAVSPGGAQDTFVLHTTNTGVDDTGPLSSQDARYLQLLLEGLGKNGKLSPAQLVEFKKLIDRFNEYGLEADDVKKIEQLGKLIEGIQKVTDKLGVDKVANQLDYIETMIGHILDGLKKVKNAEYEKFKSLIGENKTQEQAKKIVDEAGAGFAQGWVEQHWLRYQIEMLKGKLDTQKK